MELSYETNPGINYIASKMSETAMEKIQSSVREEVTRTYAEAVFEQIGKAGDGMEEAADGSGKLQEGIRELASGNEQIERIYRFWQRVLWYSEMAVSPWKRD